MTVRFVSAAKFRTAAFTDDLLPCEGLDSIGIAVEIAADTVHDDILRYVRGDDAVEISLLCEALVIGDGASVRKVQRLSLIHI